jgi:hypothetical protein
LSTGRRGDKYMYSIKLYKPTTFYVVSTHVLSKFTMFFHCHSVILSLHSYRTYTCIVLCFDLDILLPNYMITCARVLYFQVAI